MLCTQAFYYLEDPRVAALELRRVLRPGGAALISVPVVWEYDRGNLEHRFTEPSLRRVFDGWDDVTVVENGGWGVSWAAVTGSLFARIQERLAARFVLRTLARPGVRAPVRGDQRHRARARGARLPLRSRLAPAPDEPADQRPASPA